MADNIEKRLEELKGEVEELKSAIPAGTSKKWKALAIAGIWLGAAAICFSPHATEHFSHIALYAFFATVATMWWWD